MSTGVGGLNAWSAQRLNARRYKLGDTANVGVCARSTHRSECAVLVKFAPRFSGRAVVSFDCFMQLKGSGI